MKTLLLLLVLLVAGCSVTQDMPYYIIKGKVLNKEVIPEKNYYIPATISLDGYNVVVPGQDSTFVHKNMAWKINVSGKWYPIGWNIYDNLQIGDSVLVDFLTENDCPYYYKIVK